MAHRAAGLRLLLLACVAIGIAGMHTLGHPANHGDAPAAHSFTSMTDHPALVVVAFGTWAHDGSATGMRLDPTAVCVAVLVAGVLIFLSALLAARRRRLGDADPYPDVVAAAGRGPPPAPVGLRLADLSVLRT